MLKTNFRLFKIFGIPLEINVSWFIIFGLVSWSLVSFYFPAHYPSFSVATHWVMGLVAALLLFVSVILHELGHSIVAKTHGVPIKRITLFLFGGVSQLAREAADPLTEIKIAIAGPAVSYALMMVFFALYHVVSRSAGPEGVAPVLRYLAYVNGILGTFNLIPGFPLDGGRLLRAILWKVSGNLRKATHIASRVGSIIGIIFIVLGILLVLRGAFIGGFWLVLIGFFLRQAAGASYFQVVIDSTLKGVTVGDIMTPDVVTVPEGLSIQSLVDDYFFKYHFDCFPVSDEGALRGLITVSDLKDLPKARWRETRVGEIMQPDSPRIRAGVDEEASQVLRRTLRDRYGKLPVVSGDRIVGIITRRDIMEALRVFSDLRR